MTSRNLNAKSLAGSKLLPIISLGRLLNLEYLSTIWLYLFFLPFQLVDTLGYLAIVGVATASFLYLGFLAAGEEIEVPFGKPTCMPSPLRVR